MEVSDTTYSSCLQQHYHNGSLLNTNMFQIGTNENKFYQLDY